MRELKIEKKDWIRKMLEQQTEPSDNTKTVKPVVPIGFKTDDSIFKNYDKRFNEEYDKLSEFNKDYFKRMDELRKSDPELYRKNVDRGDIDITNISIALGQKALRDNYYLEMLKKAKPIYK